MKNLIPMNHFTKAPVWIVAALSIASPLTAATAEENQPKPLTLFMGSDVSVGHGKKHFKIADISGSSFVIMVGGEKILVPMLGGQHELKIAPSLKLTDVSATVTGFKCDRAYTPGRDPVMQRQIKSMEVSAAIGDGASLSEGRFVSSMNGSFAAGSAPPTVDQFGTAISTGGARAISDAAQEEYKNAVASGMQGPGLGALAARAGRSAADAANMEQAAAAARAGQMGDQQLYSDVAGGAASRLRAGDDQAKEQFDAVEAEFEISSETPLKQPFVVLIVRSREKEGDPRTARNMVYARALNEIGAKPQKIQILKGGLPPGYTLEKYQVHLYNAGREIASDVAPQRVPLTRDDAFAYMKIEYLSTHKGETLTTVPALGKLDKLARSTLTDPQLNRVYFVKVSKDGLPLEAFADEACSQPVEPMVGTVVNGVRFYPALNKGKPVEGVARLVLTELSI
jgi:hypothetical protein